jgi:hypothetical protein
LWTLDVPSSPGADGAAATVPTAKRTVTSGRGACRSEPELSHLGFAKLGEEAG